MTIIQQLINSIPAIKNPDRDITKEYEVNTMYINLVFELKYDKINEEWIVDDIRFYSPQTENELEPFFESEIEKIEEEILNSIIE